MAAADLQKQEARSSSVKVLMEQTKRVFVVNIE